MVHFFSLSPSSDSRSAHSASSGEPSTSQASSSKLKSLVGFGSAGKRASRSPSSSPSDEEAPSPSKTYSAPHGTRPSIAWISTQNLGAGGRALSPQQSAQANTYPFPVPISRAASVPTSSHTHQFYSPLPPPPPRHNPKLHVVTNFSSGHGGRPQSRQIDYSDWARYPIAKHLSPITEQDYTSPQTIGETIPLPEVQQDFNEPPSSVMRKESQGQRSDITRPSPVYLHQAFISRPLNRSLSQASSGTHRTASMSSSVPNSAVAPHPPIIPPLDLTPAFPGPHRANTLEGGPTRRDHHASPVSFVSSASAFSPYGAPSDVQSFRTASEAMRDVYEDEEEFSDPGPEDFTMSLSPTAVADDTLIVGEDDDDGTETHSEELDETADIADELPSRSYIVNAPPVVTGDTTLVASAPSPVSPVQRPARTAGSPPLSNSSSFIHQRWDRVTAFGTSLAGAFHQPRIEQPWTPACLTFWLGFSFPLLWLYGGWYFTVYQETGMTWRAIVKQEHHSFRAVGKRAQGQASGKKSTSGKEGMVLPLWAMHQCHPDESMNMSGMTEDERRSVQKLYLGYPFVNSRVSLPPNSNANNPHCGAFDFLSKVPVIGIDLINAGEEGGSRRLDPWIWRCRVAFVLFAICSIIVTIVLLAIYLPRALQD